MDNLRIVAVSKGRSIEEILRLYEKGWRCFGESRIQEAITKQSQLPPDIEWHFIGRLQRNKAAKARKLFSCIHSVDSLALAQDLASDGPSQSVLIQINTSKEQTKAGWQPEELMSIWPNLMALSKLSIQGFMTIAPHVSDKNLIREAFRLLRACQQYAQRESDRKFPVLSMGMSDDYALAIQEGATILRLGRILFDTPVPRSPEECIRQIQCDHRLS